MWNLKHCLVVLGAYLLNRNDHINLIGYIFAPVNLINSIPVDEFDTKWPLSICILNMKYTIKKLTLSWENFKWLITHAIIPCLLPRVTWVI